MGEYMDSRSRAILFFILGIYPLIVVPIGPDYFYMPRYLFLVLAALSGLYVLSQTMKMADWRHYGTLLLFLALLSLSTVFSIDPMNSWMDTYRSTGLSTYLFCAILFLLASRYRQQLPLFKPLIGGGVIVAVLAILQWLDFGLVPREEFRSWMIASTMGNPNFLGTYMVFLLPAPMWFYLEEKRPLWLIAAGLLFAGLLVSMTRGTWLAGLIMFIFILLRVRKSHSRMVALIHLALVFMVVFCIMAPMRDNAILSRIVSIQPEVQSSLRLEDEGGAGRMEIWKESIKLFPSYWALGMGPENLRYANIILKTGELADKTHNIYLELLITTGIFGLLAFLLFLAQVVKRPGNFQEEVLFSMIMAYLLQGFFNIDVVMIMPVFWVILGFSYANKLRADSTWLSSVALSSPHTGIASPQKVGGGISMFLNF